MNIHIISTNQNKNNKYNYAYYMNIHNIVIN